ncbi:MAG: hypothetical protein ACFFG0_06135 [Candidatus Thorarchaeota archaeon]
MSENVKIELELDQELMQKIDIIAKAFGWTSKQFIVNLVIKDVKFIQWYTEKDWIEELRDYYKHRDIKRKELKKL